MTHPLNFRALAAWVAGTLVALTVVLLPPVIFVWLLVGLIIGWALVASFMWALWHERAIGAESDLIFAAPFVFGSNGTQLRIVAQRTADHDTLPVADGFFPVHDRIEDDDLTALIRATEER